jgi:hypothetical protein
MLVQTSERENLGATRTLDNNAVEFPAQPRLVQGADPNTKPANDDGAHSIGGPFLFGAESEQLLNVSGVQETPRVDGGRGKRVTRVRAAHGSFSGEWWRV